MRRFFLASLLLSSGLFLGCTTPVSQTGSPMAVQDKDTTYVVDERPDGFYLTVNYERYQFIPETSALIVACKSALTSLAYDIADRRGKKIAPINEQRIRLSTGRNGLAGTTSCQAGTVVEWQK